jgi:outer membrane protein TolC
VKNQVTNMSFGRFKSLGAAAGCAFACLVFSGCLDPGKLDKTLLTKYQQTLQKQGPQVRAGREGLDLLRPMPSPDDIKLNIVKDPVTGKDAVLLSLDDAIRLSVKNSLDIRIVGYDAAISREQMTQAAAAFDWTVFGSYNHNVLDERTTNPLITPGFQKTDALEMGVKETNPLGGQFQAKWDATYTFQQVLSPINPPINPSWTSLTTFQITQPLLRGFGTDFNLSQLHLAQIGSKSQYAVFRQKVLETIDAVEQAYWNLVQARGELVILRAVLEEAKDTQDKLEKRKELDVALNLEYKQALAAVRTREANVIAQAKTVGDAEDTLARLLSDSRLNALRTNGIKPDVDEPPISETQIDRTGQLVAAMRYNPTLEQARYAIQSADINVLVAKNQALPGLNLNAAIAPQGLEHSLGNAMNDQTSGHFINWSVGVAWEYPIGNRGPEALIRQRKLEKQKALTDMQNVADQLAVSIDEAIRLVYAAVEEYSSQRDAVQAYTDYLAALDAALEVGKQSYLVLIQQKLDTQDKRGNARGAALQSQMLYHQSLARLSRLTGTTLQQHSIQLAVEAVADLGIDKDGRSKPEKKK